MDIAEENFDYNSLNVVNRKLGNGKPLIILHGWGSNSEVMLPLATTLGEIRTCYLVDLPGFGKSDQPKKPWSVGDYADMIMAFIEENKLDGKIDLLVHSFGARITLKLLSDPERSGRFDNVLITGGAGLKPKRSAGFYLKKYTAKLLKLPFAILPGSLRDKGLETLRSTSLWKSLGSSDYQKLDGVMRETFVKTVTEYLDHTLKEIDHNCLLVWGESDPATPIEQGQRMEKGLSNGVLIKVEGAGHYAFLDQPERFSSIAKAFFTESDKQAKKH